MAGGDNGFSLRAITEDQNEEESADHQLMFKYFKENKVDIASAITKPFPFLMSLRDRDFISEEMYQTCEESCGNLVPVERVVYDILSDLQNTFSLQLLEVIFKETHLKAYPDLERTLRKFGNVSNHRRTLQRINGRDIEERPSLPAVAREASCSPRNSQMNDGQAEQMPSLPQCSGGEGSSFCEQTFNGQQPQDDSRSTPEHEAASCSPRNSQMNDGQAEQMPSQPQCSGEGTEQSTSENMKCPCVMCSPRYVPEDWRARMGSSQTDTVDTGNSDTARKPNRKMRKKKGHNWSRVKQRKRPQTVPPRDGRRAGGKAAFKKKNPRCPARNRVQRNSRNKNADFNAELLPVTCGKVKGVLHKDKFKKGISVKSIQSEKGDWFTPPRFEILGGHGRSKNWKLSVRCYNRTLKWLIERNFLPIPPRKYGKRKRKRQNLYRSPADPCIKNSNLCEVCQHWGTLFCCDTCPRAFHEECHIPVVEAEISPWSCIFCRMQTLGSQQTHSESEILRRQMEPQGQLKCEFVLLRVYCHSYCSVFPKTRHSIRETSRGMRKHMLLDTIKKKLRERIYSHVEEFVQDMRLIFQNHRASFKHPTFGQMGLKLELEFEKTFKEVFAIQEANEKS